MTRGAHLELGLVLLTFATTAGPLTAEDYPTAVEETAEQVDGDEDNQENSNHDACDDSLAQSTCSFTNYWTLC